MVTKLQAVCRDTKVAPLSGSELLPEAFRLNLKYDGMSEEDMLKRIKRNPIVQICTRLAACRVNRDGSLYDPKAFGIKGRRRLYLMIGARLKNSTFDKLSRLSNRQWKTIEESWVAVMHSVLLHSEFNPVIRDRKLRIAISKFKVWFIEQSLRGKVVRPKGKRPIVKLTMWDKVLKALKTISGWFQFYSLDEPQLNLRPPQIPWFFGWKSDHPTFPWFGGHLEHFKDLEGKTLSDLDIRTLCQIRTFGRALPPPSAKLCIDDLTSQSKVLTTFNPVEPQVLQRVSEVSRLIAEKLHVEDMPLRSHISVSTSGCFEVPQREGGIAAHVRRWVKELDVPIQTCRIRQNGELHDFIRHRLINKSEVYRDCYGNRMFPIPWAGDDPAFCQAVEKDPKLLDKAAKSARSQIVNKNNKLLDKFYRQSGHFRKWRSVRQMLETNIYPQEVCPAILAMASSEAIGQGFFQDLHGVPVEPSAWLVLPSGREIPIFNRNTPLRYICVDFPHVQMQCLAEPGAKTRSLGKNQAWFVIVTKIMRFMVEPILARDGRARIGLVSTNKMWSFLKHIQRNNSHGQWLQSTDYKASTDWISLDMIKHMWKPFFSMVDKGHPCLVYEDLVYCRRNLHFSGIFEKCQPADNVHRCGSFMGEPMSFMTLTFINLVIEELSSSWNNIIQCFRSEVKDLRSHDPVAICGDDVAAVRKQLIRIKIFKHVTHAVGMKLSWKDGVSRRLMIFCEEHVCVQNKKFIYIDVVKSRLLTTMARQHSDNRSAILGKGRMLNSQLAYLDNKLLKIFVMKIYDQVFNRCHNYIMDNMHLPYFLPPSCGGLGYPISDSQIPDWAYAFIGYIYRVIEQPNILARFSSVYEIQRLTNRNKHGIDNSKEAQRVFAKMAHTEDIQYKDEEILQFESRTVYPDDRIRELLMKIGVTVPNDPYTGGADRDHLRNEAARFGIIRLDDIFDQIERTLNFNEFFRREVVREQRTFEQWTRQSYKYWKRNLFNASNFQREEYARYGREKFENFYKLDNQVLRAFSGYVLPNNWGTLESAGPSLQIDFRLYRAKAERYPFVDRKPIEINQLIYSTPICA